MKYFLLILLFLTPLILPNEALAGSKDDQKKIKKSLKQATAFYDDEDWYNASNSLLAARDLGATLTTEQKKMLARCYVKLNDMPNAWYLYMEMENELTGEDVFNYAYSMHCNANYEEAISWYNRSKMEGANVLRVNDLIDHCKWAMNNTEFKKVRVNPCAELLSATQSFGIQYYNDVVVYSSAVEGAKTDRFGNAFLNLYCSTIRDGVVMDNTSRIFSKNLMSPYNVGATCFTSDKKYIYYTKSVIVGDRDIFKIFVAEFDGNDWVNERELTINSNDYDCVQPALSLDDNYLYFVSNKEGGYGGKDIYYCERKGPNSFGKVKNLGSTINTNYDEVYPVINRDGKLYFSSNGHLGFGGLDIFSAELIDNKWQNVTNMMHPFNSEHDDFFYIMDPERDGYGFISSNNMGDGFTDKIFTVRPLETDNKPAVEMAPMIGGEMLVFDANGTLGVVETQPEPEPEPEPEPVVIPEPEPEPVPVVAEVKPYVFKTIVTSTFNGTKLAGATVTIRDAATGELITSATSDASGSVVLTIPGKYIKDGAEYSVKVSKDGFNGKEVIATLDELENVGKEGVALTPIFNDNVLDDISGMAIPYEGDLDANAKATLDKLAAYLIQNSGIVVKLNGHTEAKGNRRNNLDVSQKMADKAKAYLVSKGVNDDQLIPRGYGERYLKNRCHRGVYCERSQHMENRRIEVVVWNVRK